MLKSYEHVRNSLLGSIQSSKGLADSAPIITQGRIRSVTRSEVEPIPRTTQAMISSLKPSYICISNILQGEGKFYHYPRSLEWPGTDRINIVLMLMLDLNSHRDGHA